MTYVAVALLWVASVYRVTMARRRPDFISLTYCAAALGITLAFTAKAAEAPLDRFTTANLSDLVEHLLVVVGGVSAQLFLLALRMGRPTRRETVSRLSIAVLVVVLMNVLFAIAPVHHVEADLDAAFGGLGTVTFYRVAFDGYLTYVLIDNARLCRRYAAVPGDLGRSVSLQLIGWGSMIAIGYSGSRLIYAFTDITFGKKPEVLHTAGSSASAIGLCAIALGVLALPVLTSTRRWYAAVRGLRQVHVLWRDLAESFPEITLRTEWAISPRRAELRYDRHLVEIAEGLARSRLPAAVEAQAESVDGRLDALAAALRQHRATWTAEADLTAASHLPASHTHKHEHAQLCALAATYAGGQNREGPP